MREQNLIPNIIASSNKGKCRAIASALEFGLKQCLLGLEHAQPQFFFNGLRSNLINIINANKDKIEMSSISFDVNAIIDLIISQVNDVSQNHSTSLPVSSFQDSLNRFKNNIKEMKHLKTIDKLLSLSTRKANLTADMSRFDRDDYSSFKRHVIKSNKNKLGLFRYIDEDIKKAPWFCSLSSNVEKIYFINLVHHLRQVVTKMNSHQSEITVEDANGLLESIYPFFSTYPYTPVIANAAIYTFSLEGRSEGVDSESKSSNVEPEMRPLFPRRSGQNLPEINHVKVARIALPDLKKKGSKQEKESIVRSIVNQALILNQEDNDARAKRINTFWGDVSIDRVHSMVTTIDNIGLSAFPSDKLYEKVGKEVWASSVEHCLFNRFPLNATREYASISARHQARQEQRQFITLAQNNADKIDVNQCSPSANKRYAMLQEAISLYKDLSRSIEGSFGQQLGREFVENDRENKQLRLAQMHVTICHLLGWSFHVNCKSSKDRTGLLTAAACADMATYCQYNCFSSDVYKAAGRPVPIQAAKKAAISCYREHFVLAYKDQIEWSEKNSPGTYGLKNKANIESSSVTTRLASFIFSPIIGLLSGIRKTVNWVAYSCQRASGAVSNRAGKVVLGVVAAIASIAVSPLVLAYTTVAGTFKSIVRAFQSNPVVQTPKQEQQAINSDDGEALLLTNRETTTSKGKTVFKALTRVAKNNKTKQKKGWGRFFKTKLGITLCALATGLVVASAVVFSGGMAVPVLAATAALGVFAVGGIASGISSKINDARQKNAAKNKMQKTVGNPLHRASPDCSERMMPQSVENPLYEQDSCVDSDRGFRRISKAPEVNRIQREIGQRSLISGSAHGLFGKGCSHRRATSSSAPSRDDVLESVYRP